MREIKKMSYKDIAKELKRNLSTVKSQIRNGRVILIKGTFKEFKQIDDLY
jgi:DNA-directed RNA polymerase specialized sigma24 family protein